MVICICIDSYNDKSNGTSMAAFRFASKLLQLGHEVRIITTICTNASKQQSFKNKDDIDIHIGSNNEKIYYVKERYIPLVTEISKKQHIVFGFPQTDVIHSALKNCDILHCYMPFQLELVSIQIARMLKIPYMAAFHIQPQHVSYNIGLNCKMMDSLVYKIFNRFYKYVFHLHCPSLLIKNEVDLAQYGGKKYVISNGFDVKMYDIKKQNFNDDFFHIACVGRYSKEKRQDILIKAINVSKYKNKIKLHLKGLGPREKYLKNLCNKFLANEVDFGFSPSDVLFNTISQCHLYVHPAQVESEAISCLEAISLGLVPIIADSKISATNQFAFDERNIFKTNNIYDLAKKIDYFIENEEVLSNLSELYKLSALNYTLQHSVEKILLVYNECIKDFKNNPALFSHFNNENISL